MALRPNYAYVYGWRLNGLALIEGMMRGGWESCVQRRSGFEWFFFFSLAEEVFWSIEVVISGFGLMGIKYRL